MWAAFFGEVRPLILLWGEIGYCDFLIKITPRVGCDNRLSL